MFLKIVFSLKLKILIEILVLYILKFTYQELLCTKGNFYNKSLNNIL